MIPDEIRKEAIDAVAVAMHNKYCFTSDGTVDCAGDCHDDAVLAVDVLTDRGLSVVRGTS